MLTQGLDARHHQRRIPVVVATAVGAVIGGAVAPHLVQGGVAIGVALGAFVGVVMVGRGRGFGFGGLGGSVAGRLIGFDGLEEGIGAHHVLDFLLEFERRQLQQLDRALQEGGHGQVLTGTKLQGRGHGNNLQEVSRGPDSVQAPCHRPKTPCLCQKLTARLSEFPIRLHRARKFLPMCGKPCRVSGRPSASQCLPPDERCDRAPPAVA
jgi:hypothetical protein